MESFANALFDWGQVIVPIFKALSFISIVTLHFAEEIRNSNTR